MKPINIYRMPKPTKNEAFELLQGLYRKAEAHEPIQPDELAQLLAYFRPVEHKGLKGLDYAEQMICHKLSKDASGSWKRYMHVLDGMAYMTNGFVAYATPCTFEDGAWEEGNKISPATENAERIKRMMGNVQLIGAPQDFVPLEARGILKTGAISTVHVYGEPDTPSFIQIDKKYYELAHRLFDSPVFRIGAVSGGTTVVYIKEKDDADERRKMIIAIVRG